MQESDQYHQCASSGEGPNGGSTPAMTEPLHWQGKEGSFQIQTRSVDRPSLPERDSSRSKAFQITMRNLDEIVKPNGPLSYPRWIVGKCINDPRVEGVILLLVLINAILITLSTFSLVYDDPKLEKALNTTDTIFLSIFTLESSMQIIYHGLWGSLSLFRDHWLTFDLVIVLISWIFNTLQMFRSLRVIRLLSKIESIKDLMNSMFRVIPKLIAIFSLLVLVMYIFAVMFTMLFQDLSESDLPETYDYFARLDKTFFSLFQFMTMDWIGSCAEVTEQYYWAPIFYVGFLTVSGFIVLNLIVAVMCDALNEWGEQEDKADEMEENRRRMDKINRLSLEVEGLKEQAKETDLIMESMMKEIVRLRAKHSSPVKSKTLVCGVMGDMGD